MKSRLFSIIILTCLLLTVQFAWAQLTITSGGQVGIGTDTPDTDAKLHVVHDSKYAGYFTSSYLNSDTKILQSIYNGSSGDYNVVAVHGVSEPNDGYGHGGTFIGGYMGVGGMATKTGDGDRCGVFGVASGGNSTNYGVYADGED